MKRRKRKIGGLRKVLTRLRRRGYAPSARRRSSDALGARQFQFHKRIGSRIVVVSLDVKRGKLRAFGSGSGYASTRTPSGAYRGRLLTSHRGIRRDAKGRFA